MGRCQECSADRANERSRAESAKDTKSKIKAWVKKDTRSLGVPDVSDGPSGQRKWLDSGASFDADATEISKAGSDLPKSE